MAYRRGKHREEQFFPFEGVIEVVVNDKLMQ